MIPYTGGCVRQKGRTIFISMMEPGRSDVQILENARETAAAFGSAIAGMPVKDTIKIADENQYVKETPLRSSVWQVQTSAGFPERACGFGIPKTV